MAVAAGMQHSLALTEGGEVYSWGHLQHGRLGHGPTSLRLFGASCEFKPRLVRAFEALRITQVRGAGGPGAGAWVRWHSPGSLRRWP